MRQVANRFAALATNEDEGNPCKCCGAEVEINGDTYKPYIKKVQCIGRDMRQDRKVSQVEKGKVQTEVRKLEILMDSGAQDSF